VRSERDLDAVLQPIAAGPWSRITLRTVPIGDPATELVREMLSARGGSCTKPLTRPVQSSTPAGPSRTTSEAGAATRGSSSDEPGDG
jgi:hypothetical protein